MLLEIKRAVNFLVRLLQGQHNAHNVKRLNEEQLTLFKDSLIRLLESRYQDHWYPDQPDRGSAYRCIQINRRMDPIVAQAIRATGCSVSSIRPLFPHALTLWIDPEEISYRFGESYRGSIWILHDDDQEVTPTQPREPSG
ncbi:Protein btg1 [Homalodisca vitripennis]|nr:Protein btg1 [Homalodisca vitripennis]